MVHLNIGTLSGPDHDHITSIVQLSPCTDQHCFHNTLDCFDYPRTKFFFVIHRCSDDVTLHKLPQKEMFKTVLSGEQRGQEMGPNLILTS